MENNIVKVLIVVAVGGITWKAVRAAKLYKEDMARHEEIIEDSEQD